MKWLFTLFTRGAKATVGFLEKLKAIGENLRCMKEIKIP
jgi:hypothetical protein